MNTAALRPVSGNPRFCMLRIYSPIARTYLKLSFDPFGVCVFVPMFSGWHKSKNANYGTRSRPFFHSSAIGHGGHAPPFSMPFMLILVVFAPKSELWQQITPNSHRYARLWSPCGAFVWAVHLMVLTANYGNRYAHQMGHVQV